ncbi:hypothetical protein BKA82DRAFT_785785 [Pisolithus tinctorius]|uniref:Uncharacterized protein n=1 Tax=Pisolithus tinctorius Marx 270 TaxID=870435 RepID=A0A0C3JQN6_PISTI|nr:hypothetical protein BKA82DRAFT_785785 [Pisolithus tinctorius]KIO11488.1 hypothetical protein M404DRAFT_785785 [Pisolithus tinctorius Marx 270]
MDSGFFDPRLLNSCVCRCLASMASMPTFYLFTTPSSPECFRSVQHPILVRRSRSKPHDPVIPDGQVSIHKVVTFKQLARFNGAIIPEGASMCQGVSLSALSDNCSSRGKPVTSTMLSFCNVSVFYTLKLSIAFFFAAFKEQFMKAVPR